MLTTKICVPCFKRKEKKKTLLSIRTVDRDKSNLSRGCVLLCHPLGSRVAWASPRHPAALRRPRRRPRPRSATRLRGRDCGQRSGRSGAVTGPGGMGGSGGKGAAGWGRRAESRSPSAQRGPRVQSARSLEAPPVLPLLPELPRVRRRLSRLLGEACSPASRGQDPASRAPGRSARRSDSHKLPPARRGHCSPRASYLHGAHGSGFHSRPPGSAARAPAAEGAAAPGCACGEGRSAINTRRRRRRGSASGAGGGRPRSEPSEVARGGGEGGAGGVGGERAQGRHGRLDAGPSAARAGRSGAERRAAASPPRAPAERPQPCALAGAAASEARPREVKAVAPLPGPEPAPRRGEPGAAQPEPRGQQESHSPLQRPGPRPARRRAPPHPARGQVRRGQPPRERASPIRASPPPTCTLLGPWPGADPSVLRHQTEGRKRWGVRCATRDTPILQRLKATRRAVDPRTG